MYYLWSHVVQPFFSAISSLVTAPRNVHCPAATLQAKASVQKDADAIKKHIKEKHQSFEYVNRTVEHALWCEVIEYLERSESAQPSHESTSTGPATTLTESDVSMEKSEMPSAHAGKCILQWNFDSSSRCSFDRLGFDDIYLLGVKHANRKRPICRLALTHFAGWYSILVSPWSFSKGHPTALLQGCLVFHGARPRKAGKPQRERNEERNKRIFQANDLILWLIAPNLYEFRSGSWVLHAWSCARLCEWKHTSLWVQDMERKLTCRQYYIPNKRVHFLNTCGWNWFIASSTFACCFQLNTHCLSQDAVKCRFFC